MGEYPSLAVRIWRRRPWAANPLLRVSDRFEAAVHLFAVGVVLVAIPLCVLLGVPRGSAAVDRIRAENATKAPVAATLVTDPVGGAVTAPLEPATEQYDATVRWPYEGTSHEDVAVVPRSAHRGDQLRVWVGPDGRLVGRPASVGLAPLSGIGFGVATFIEILGATAVFVLVVGKSCDGWRGAAWEREWRRRDALSGVGTYE